MKQEQAQQYIEEISKQTDFEGDSPLETKLHTHLTDLLYMQQTHIKKIDEMTNEISESEKHLISINGQLATLSRLLIECEDERIAKKTVILVPDEEELDALMYKE